MVPSCLIHPPNQWPFPFLPYPSTVTSGRRRRHHQGTGPEVTRCLAAVLPRSHGWKGCAARLLVCYPVVLLLFLPCLRSSPWELIDANVMMLFFIWNFLLFFNLKCLESWLDLLYSWPRAKPFHIFNGFALSRFLAFGDILLSCSSTCACPWPVPGQAVCWVPPGTGEIDRIGRNWPRLEPVRDDTSSVPVQETERDIPPVSAGTGTELTTMVTILTWFNN
jgi:hypothetical protein